MLIVETIARIRRALVKTMKVPTKVHLGNIGNRSNAYSVASERCYIPQPYRTRRLFGEQFASDRI
jgi:hypothetical protein